MNEINHGLILVPALALGGWTMTILLLIPYRRFKAIARGELTARDFILGESDRVSPYVALANRNYMNLLEFPILFYVACLVFYVAQGVSTTVLVLAWLYVGLRIAHSLVHVTYNNVRHRLRLFAGSNFVMMGLWVILVVPVLRTAGIIS